MLEAAILCLAQNIYFEARDQDLLGQMAVAEVTMNRVDSPRWPDDVCGVVWQDKQFSWTHDGKSDRMYNEKARHLAMQLADAYVNARIESFLTEGATHYHSYKVNPYWASKLEPTVTIGYHTFYK